MSAPLKEFVRHIYLRSTNFVSVMTPKNGYRESKIRLIFRAGAQIDRGMSFRDRKSLSIRRVRQQCVFRAYPIPERVHL